jgi:hypothetical protein
MPLYESPPLPYGSFRLDRVDGKTLPLRLPYRHTHCSVVGGNAQVTDQQALGSDGVIIITIFGMTFGHTEKRQIFFEREPFDQLDHRHLTFPGGWRKWRRTVRPHCVARVFDEEIVLTTIRAEAARSGLPAVFGDHEWHFVRMRDVLVASGPV